ncbi:hypothetical protein FACS1894122_05240 [Alphaproteobacteria bacterium]|nr:hypothetical protein FACS1894122_05240 [Alphaproteobacteria bacterium]
MNKRNFLCSAMLSTFLWYSDFAECMELAENSGNPSKIGTTVTLLPQVNDAKHKQEALQSYVDNISQRLYGKNVVWDSIDYENIESDTRILASISSLKTFGEYNFAAASASLRLASDLIGKQLISLKKIEEDGGSLKHPVEYQAALSMFQEMDTLVKATSEDLKYKIGVSIVTKPDGSFEFAK